MSNSNKFEVKRGEDILTIKKVYYSEKECFGLLILPDGRNEVLKIPTTIPFNKDELEGFRRFINEDYVRAEESK